MDEGLKNELQKSGIFILPFEQLYNWGRKSSIWPLQFGLACCAIEMIATAASRHDLARFGAEVFRATPRQADLMIACAISGGPFKDGYNVLKGIDRYIPVDVHIPGCPPRPEALLHAIMTLQRKIAGQHLGKDQRPRWYDDTATTDYPIPSFGERDLEPSANREVWQPPRSYRDVTIEEALKKP
jgi:NADH-quinone oxidoreductase subunit B